MCEERSQRSGRERSDEMVTLNANGSAGRSRWVSLVAAVALIAWSAAAHAQARTTAASDYPGGYVVLPKIIVHTTGGTPPVALGGIATDTLIQMSNTNEAAPITVDCWWVDANSHCGAVCNPTVSDCVICETNADCAAQGLPGLNCVTDWSVRDFQVTLTNGQPIGFLASSGLNPVPCDPGPPAPPSTCQAAGGGSVQPVQEDPFRGELKCVQVDVNDVPVLRSDLKIEATIISTGVPSPIINPPPGVATTAASYNGIGFAALDDGTGDPADPLCLGSLPTGSPDACAATYVPCPGVLILDSFFEGATTEIGGIVNTELTLVPCSENLGDPTVGRDFDVLAQMLIYNEFEQRLSTSARVECFRSTPLLLIGNPNGSPQGVFSVGTQGTLTGQTRIRGVQGSNGPLGFGLLGVATENYRTTPTGDILATDAFNLHNSGFRANGDAVYRTQFPPAPPPP